MSSTALRPIAAPELSLERLEKVLARRGGSAAESGPAASVLIRGVTLDSRQVQPGDLYAALPGARVHGAMFAAAAAAAGAVAVMTDPAGAAIIGDALSAAVLTVTDPRAVLGDVAAAIYGDPTRHLSLLGVTGTNGKTTVAYLLEAGLAAAGHRTGLIGTVQTRIADAVVPSVRTTPEAPELQALFATMRERGVDAAAMEVSSHALALHRVDGCHFAGAAFTNLSQDHLDFHDTIEDYFEAKASLFDAQHGFVPPGRAVICVDDEYGRRLARRHPDAVTFGFGADADWRAVDARCGPVGSEFGVLAPGADVAVRAHVALPGSFNVSNALCSIALLAQTGTPLEAALDGVGGLVGVPGRMERVDAGQPFLALVDYAHTPAAVTSLLQTVRELVPGRLLLVLGCGGDRDRGKRPLMGAAAVFGADEAVLTSDNPRSEDPLEILAEMSEGARTAAAGMSSVGEFVVEPDRAAAIALAVRRAQAGDAVIVAGKGHETGQDIGGVVHPFDDREVLRAALSSSAAG
ncbi:MAG TPA: UDP-N-acetylmuramoyl-L-alanyl-D-glutamate--2,6-diaminopimelate ligase [Frankiaceae bacterium]|nr:UDP-N-acetylmuramoyl-L-alanyl-D-glutamate--2,6-diaminopimelate ligase [Frankiaceae bacterium]